MRSWRPSCAASARPVRRNALSGPGSSRRRTGVLGQHRRRVPRCSPRRHARAGGAAGIAPDQGERTGPRRRCAVRTGVPCGPRPWAPGFARRPCPGGDGADPGLVRRPCPGGADPRAARRTATPRRGPVQPPRNHLRPLAPDLGVACTRPRTGSTSSGDRVRGPRARREGHVLEAGARAQFHCSSRLVEDDIAAGLNDDVTAEISTIVLMAGALASPELPRSFHISCPRQPSRAMRAMQRSSVAPRRTVDDGSLLTQQVVNYECEFGFVCETRSQHASRVSLVSRARCPERSPSTGCLDVAVRDTIGRTRVRPGVGLRRSPRCTRRAGLDTQAVR